MYIARMSLIPSLSALEMLAAVPLFVVLAPFFFATLKALMSNPIVDAAVNATLVVLKTTEVVWRPAYDASLTLARDFIKALVFLAPYVKAFLVATVNATQTLIHTVRESGLSFASAFPTVITRIKELGEALVVIARTLGVAVYYMVRGMSIILGSFEKVFTFGKQIVFEAHLPTAEDISNVMLPFAVVLAVTALVYLTRKTNKPIAETYNENYEPRRSSRLARKRAMLYADDMSDALPCKEVEQFVKSPPVFLRRNLRKKASCV